MVALLCDYLEYRDDLSLARVDDGWIGCQRSYLYRSVPFPHCNRHHLEHQLTALEQVEQIRYLGLASLEGWLW